jgi:tetratricopeptide (TPR) repeat protein
MGVRPFILTCTVCVLFAVLGCGPDNIFLKAGLDTPEQHVENGNQLMNYGKFDAARQEFNRAIELSPHYSPAYVGLGLATGYLGNPELGLATMEKARELAQDEDQQKNVESGFEVLQSMVDTKE